VLSLRGAPLVAAGIFALGLAPTAWADKARCEIRIEDVKKGNTYTLEHAFEFERGSTRAQRKHFDTPGSDYTCTLAFFDLERGTMLSCELKTDRGTTFVQSDRTLLNDREITNNLSFRNRSTFLVIKTRCR
jgi:hypothetical protein